jgi:hypothetical protein
MVSLFLIAVIFFWVYRYKDIEFKKDALNRFKIDSTRIVNLQNKLLDKSKEAIYWRGMFYEVVKCKPIEQTKSYINSLKNKQQ